MCRMTVNNVNAALTAALINITLERGKDKKTLFWRRGESLVKIDGVKLTDRTMTEWVHAAQLVSDSMDKKEQPEPAPVKKTSPVHPLQAAGEALSQAGAALAYAPEVIIFADGAEAPLGREDGGWRKFYEEYSAALRKVRIKEVLRLVGGYWWKTAFSRKGKPAGYSVKLS